jgi:hypothetical protein
MGRRVATEDPLAGPRARRWLAPLLGVALVVAAPGDARADTTSDFQVVCFDLALNLASQLTGFPFSQIASIDSASVGGGTLDWSIESSGQMPQTGVATQLEQSADTAVGYGNVTVPFGAGCQLFGGNRSTIVVAGEHVSDPGISGTAPAQIRVQYHVLLEVGSETTGTELSAQGGINVAMAQSPFFTSESLILADDGENPPELMVPQGASVTDLSAGGLTRKDVSGETLVTTMLDYGPNARNELMITFFTGSTGIRPGSGSGTLAGQTAAFGGETAVTDVTSLDPNVRFGVRFAPEATPGGLSLAALASLVALSRRRC